ncbi:Pentatricopeptide repeat [Macleaya cordata]|uniref:Pentatricopeptide repeat n=1 Tax=Macleaya cordata TaxID=56857 RepID=A0A200QRA7_MACCD|nr:Pentatricopeptide repeat [Macleaya cordata]
MALPHLSETPSQQRTPDKKFTSRVQTTTYRPSKFKSISRGNYPPFPAMLLPAILNVPQFHPYCFPLLQPSFQSSKEKKKNKYKNFTRTPCFYFRDHSFSAQTHNPENFPFSIQYPGANFSDSLWVNQLIDPTLVASWIQSCYTVKEVRRIHSVVIKCFGNSVTFVDNNLISVYVRFGKLLEARKVFDQMPERNVVSWTAILNGYLKIGSDDEVLRLFSEFVKTGIQGNSQTFVCILNLCSRRFDFELGKQIHACIVKGNWSNIIVDSAIVYFYAQFGDLSGAFRCFDRMPERDVVCWTTMITACAQHGHGKKAFSLFSWMLTEGYSPNEFTVCSVLKACGEEKALKFGRQLHGAIVKKIINDDVFVGTSLVGMYVKCEKVKDARRVFNGMRKRNTVTWTSMIAGYAQNGLGEEAIKLFRLMKRRHIFVSNLTVVSILQACGSIGATPIGKEVHAQILKSSIQSNIFIGSTLVWCYCKCGEYTYAAKVLQSMPDRDVVSWTAIISGCVHLGLGMEALQFLNEMLWEGVEPNPFTYSSALKACAKLESILQGRWIHSSVNKTKTLPNVFVGSALIDMYSKCGYVSEAIQVFNSMPERNLVSWKSMIIGYARNGLCREALELIYRMKAEGLEVDDYTMTTVLSALKVKVILIQCKVVDERENGKRIVPIGVNVDYDYSYFHVRCIKISLSRLCVRPGWYQRVNETELFQNVAVLRGFQTVSIIQGRACIYSLHYLQGPLPLEGACYCG